MKHMKRDVALWLVVLSMAVVCLSCSRFSPEYNKNKWELVWSDEFEVDGAPDPEIWTHRITPVGWVNNELQRYVDDRSNSWVEDGKLIIEATHESQGYNSARLHTQKTMNWTYGRMEVSAKLPNGVGSWPAIWMMPQNMYGYGTGWPHSGEIDIMEHVGYDQNVVHSSIHTARYNHPAGTQRTEKITIDDADQAFHLYAVDWYPDRLEFYFDDILVMVYENEGEGWLSWPFDKPFYLILNIAVGGDWGAVMGVDDQSLPYRMEIDYVRYYGRQEWLN